MASRWYNSIEGSRSRKARVNTGSLAESAIASSRRGVSDYGSAYDEDLDPLLLAELEGADDEFDEEGKRKRKPRKNASKLKQETDEHGNPKKRRRPKPKDPEYDSDGNEIVPVKRK